MLLECYSNLHFLRKPIRGPRMFLFVHFIFVLFTYEGAIVCRESFASQVPYGAVPAMDPTVGPC